MDPAGGDGERVSPPDGRIDIHGPSSFPRQPDKLDDAVCVTTDMAGDPSGMMPPAVLPEDGHQVVPHGIGHT